MSMSMHIVGYREPDDEWHRMKAVYDACETAGIGIPDEVDDFFNDEPPDEAGIEVYLQDGDPPVAREWRDDRGNGFEFDIADLPPNITKVRFYCSW